MGREDPALRGQVHVNVDVLSTKWREEVAEFVRHVGQKYVLRCVILYGSMATDSYVPGSDIDLIVIAEDLPTDFLERLRAMADLRPSRVPLEVLAYEPQEFERMLADLHVTALDSIVQGRPLTGEEYFEAPRSRVNAMMEQGLRRGRTSWILSRCDPGRE